MLNAEAEILALDSDALLLLQAYRTSGLAARTERAKTAAQEAQRAMESADFDDSETTSAQTDGAESDPPSARSAAFELDKSDPWVPRINALDDVDTEKLRQLHGKLIAAGFITFRIRDRTSGVEYRVANAGKQFLSQQEDDGEESDSSAAA